MRTNLGVLAILVVVLVPCIAAGTGEGPQEKESAVFSNKDLQHYTTPSKKKSSRDPAVKQSVDPREEKRRKTAWAKEQQEQEYWCKKGSALRIKLEKARSSVDRTKQKLSGLTNSAFHATPKKKKDLDITIKKAELELARNQETLQEREAELGTLEDEAHRKSIPPGWLRCQFSQ